MNIHMYICMYECSLVDACVYRVANAHAQFENVYF